MNPFSPEADAVQHVGYNHLLWDLESKTAVGKPCVYVSVSGITANALRSDVWGSVYLTKPRGILCRSIF